MQCPKCQNKISLKQWWKHCHKRIELVTESQTKLVANNSSIGHDCRNHPKYKQSERILKKLGFYDEFGF
jgi:hypothetical protein